jgi:hypothetical protein
VGTLGFVTLPELLLFDRPQPETAATAAMASVSATVLRTMRPNW